jgi:hypothetical protein
LKWALNPNFCTQVTYKKHHYAKQEAQINQICGTQGGESIKLQKLEHSIDLRISWHGYAEDIDTLAENGER